MKKFGRLVCAIAAMLPFLGHAEFAYEFTATVNYKGTETLVDFPVLVRLPNVVTTHMRTDGLDIRFYTEDGETELAHECESFDPAKGALIWVKVPSLAEGTKLLVKCGDPDFDTPAAGASTWSSYIGVWHLDDVKTACVDATGGTANGSVNNNCKSVDGKVATACQMIYTPDWTKGNSRKIEVINTGSLATAGKLTVSWWMMPNASGEMPRSVCSAVLFDAHTKKGHSIWNASYEMTSEAAPQFVVRSYKYNAWDNYFFSLADADEKLNLPGWTHAAVTLANEEDGLTSSGQLFRNAELLASGDGLYPVQSIDEGGKIQIGENANNYKGQMDEFRLRAAVSSVDWLTAERDSVDDLDFVKLPDNLIDILAATRRVVATAAEAKGDWADAVVAGDDAWAAIQGVIDASAVGDTVLVKPGRYELTNELFLANGLHDKLTFRSDDGAGNLARETTRFVGGYPATTNRLIKCAAQSVTIDGFTLTNGYVDATCGGAIWLDKTDAGTRILNCDFLGNTAWWAEKEIAKDSPGDAKTEGAGGAVFIEGAGVISNCLFRGNRGFSGGGIQTKSSLKVVSPVTSVPYVTRCAFVENANYGPGNNSAKYGSGRGLCAYGSVVVDHSSFVSNRIANARGTVVACSAVEGGTVSNCTFEAHQGEFVKMPGQTQGYGCSYIVDASRMRDCVMIRETLVSSPIGGDVLDGHTYSNCTYSAAQKSYTLRNCLFIDNVVESGIVYNGGGQNSHVDNCMFINNTVCFRSTTKNARTNFVNNCVFLGNGMLHHATNGDNAMGCYFIMTNCVYAGKVTDRSSTLPALMTFGCRTDLTPGTAKFFAAGRGNFRLRADSPLVGAGVTLDWMDGALDRDGNPRVVGGAPDIGCYERQEGTIDPPYPCTRAVAKEEDRTGEWKDAVVGLQAAVDVTFDYESIYAKAGTYGVAEHVGVSCDGIRLVGVGPGAVVLDGGATGTNRLLTVTGANFQLENVTLQNGSMTDQGGALYLDGANAVVSNCVIRDCLSHYEGGAVYAASGAMGLRFFDTTIVDCASTNRGGAVFLAAADATFTRCTFDSCATVQKLQDDEKGTTDRAHGGGIYVKATGLVLDTCVFTNCIAGKELRYDGGALYVDKDKGLLATNCVFVSCRALRGGAGFRNGGSVVPRYVDCTFADNVNERIPSTLWDYERGRALDGSACLKQCVFRAHSSGSRSLLESFDATGSATNCVFEGLTNLNVVGAGTISGSLFRWNEGINVKAALDRCTVVSNRVDIDGKGAVIFLQDVPMRNSLWTGNDGPLSFNGTAYIENCTVVSNVGGFRAASGAKPHLTNCLVWDTTDNFSTWDGNYVRDGVFAYYGNWTTNSLVISNCVIKGGNAVTIKGKTDKLDILSCDPSGASTQLTDLALRRGPKFVDPANGDFHLRQNSPLRDKALTLDWMTEDAVDLDGKPRRISSDGKSYPDSLPDIGCYECDIPKPGLLLQVR